MLKASARNSSAVLSLMAKCLKTPISKLMRFGLRASERPASPKVRPWGSVKAAGLKANLEKLPDESWLLGGSADKEAPVRSGNDPGSRNPLVGPGPDGGSEDDAVPNSAA